MNFRNKTYFITILLFLGVSLNAYANPQGQNVVAGSATFNNSNSKTLAINTTSNNTIINWNSFSIAADETTRFNQPSSSSSVLNRVLGVDPSEIYGTLSSNGKIFLVNPNGILFGPNSSVNAPAVLASTLDITNADFLKGNYNFFKNGGNSFIINQGRLAASPGGYIALLSQAVNNQGVIVAPLGTVALAAGDKLTLALDSQSQISVAIDDAVQNEVLGADGQQIKSAIQNSGTIQANGGKALLTTKVLNDVFDYAVNNSGVIEATSLQNHNGVVELISNGDIYSLGTLESSSLIERGNTFQVGGIFAPGDADVENTDNALVYAANTSVSGTITDPANIIVDPNITLTLKANTTFNAGSTFSMASNSTITGGGHNLSISVGSASTLGDINNVNLLTLNTSAGSNGTYKLENTVSTASLTNGATLDLNGKSLTVTGKLTNNGSLKLIGSETPSVGTFTDNGITDYYGSGNYTITPLGTYDNLQFNNGTFVLGGALKSASLTNNTALDLNGQSLKVTGTLTNNGILKLIGSETPSIGTFTDNGTTDYYGSGTYTIKALGTYDNLQFNNGTFTLGGALSSASLTNNSTLDLNGKSLTVSGTLTNNGVLKLKGSETPAIGTFIDNGITDYYGSGSYTITPLGIYHDLQFDNGTFKLENALSSTGLTNNSTLDLNGQSLTVTGKLTNNGTLKLIGNETPSIGMT